MEDNTQREELAQTLMKHEGLAKLIPAIQELPPAAPKDAKNKFAGYDYASVDSLYAAVGKVFRKSGLAVYAQELKTDFDTRELDVTNKQGEVTGKKYVTMARVTFGLAITPGGVAPQRLETLERFTVAGQITGIQTFGSLRSYAVKYWLRAKFMLVTGEVDMDEQAPQGSAKAPAETKAATPKEKKESTGQWILDQKTLAFTQTGEFPTELDGQRAFMQAVQTATPASCNVVRALRIFTANEELINALPPKGKEALNKRKTSFEKRKAATAKKEPIGEWIKNEAGKYESSGKWKSEDSKNAALVALLEKDLSPDADSETANKIFLANEELIRALPEEMEGAIYKLIDQHSITQAPGAEEASESAEDAGTDAETKDLF